MLLAPVLAYLQGFSFVTGHIVNASGNSSILSVSS